jgi:hypothetical protein
VEAAGLHVVVRIEDAEMADTAGDIPVKVLRAVTSGSA